MDRCFTRHVPCSVLLRPADTPHRYDRLKVRPAAVDRRRVPNVESTILAKVRRMRTSAAEQGGAAAFRATYFRRFAQPSSPHTTADVRQRAFGDLARRLH